jgi:septal ring factor EnvC (AmiA/AmiB activator)
MSYSKTKKEIIDTRRNPPKTPSGNITTTIPLLIVIWGLILFGIVSGAIILILPAAIIWLIWNNYNKGDNNKRESHQSTIDYLNELEKKQKKILDKYLYKFKTNKLENIEYEKRVHIEDLIEEYDRKSNEYKDLENHLNTISQENPQRIEELKREIAHFGDTIDVNDEEYISRMKEIKSLEKEIKKIELNLIYLTKERQKTQDEIFSLVRNQK